MNEAINQSMELSADELDQVVGGCAVSVSVCVGAFVSVCFTVCV